MKAYHEMHTLIVHSKKYACYPRICDKYLAQLRYKKIQQFAEKNSQHTKKIKPPQAGQSTTTATHIRNLCLYTSPPYLHSVDIYDCFEDLAFAKAEIFKPLRLIDLGQNERHHPQAGPVPRNNVLKTTTVPLATARITFAATHQKQGAINYPTERPLEPR